jgi:hypothetical protein
MKFQNTIMRMLLLFSVLGGALITTSSMAPAWKLLGTRTVNWAVDHDEVIVTGFEGDFEAIQIKVFRAPVHFRSVKVHFRNGGVQDIDLREVIPAGGQSRVIDLNGTERVISRITFWYDTARPAVRGRAVVKIFGRL